MDAFTIKVGWTGKIRMFFLVMRDPWLAVRIIEDFREECGKLEAKAAEMKTKAAAAVSDLADAKMEIARLKLGADRMSRAARMAQISQMQKRNMDRMTQAGGQFKGITQPEAWVMDMATRQPRLPQ